MESATLPRIFHYAATARWSGERRGVLASAGKPDMAVASPPEFKGHPGVWTPEDLFVSAVNSCTMMTFLAFAAGKALRLVSYESEAVGTLERFDGALRFTKIVVSPRIVVERGEDIEKAMALFRKAEFSCLITNSLVTRVEAEPRISAVE